MRSLARLVRRLRGSLSRRRGETELDEEIGFHIAMETEENLRRGLSPGEARRAAERSFGRVGHTKHAYQEARGLPWLEDAVADVKLALRSIRRSPAFASAIILLMALGIGANAAVYTVVDGVLLRPLPYPRADELLDLERVGSRGSSTRHDGAAVVELRRWNDDGLRVAALGGPAGVNLVDRELALHAQALPASHEYFDVMGVRPAQGRAFEPADELAGAVTILSHDLARRLGGDLVGRSLLVGGTPHHVVGVLPSSFRMLPRADLLIPFRMGFETTGTNYFMVARASGGLARARQAVAAASANLHQAGTLPAELDLRWVGLHRSMSEDRRETVLLLFAAVGLVLLIACANVAGLLLIKAQKRGAELAVRAALGAGPGRLVRQLLTEGLVYALAGGLVGVMVADWGLSLLLHLAPPDLADWSIAIDGRVLAFSLALTLATGVACGLIPALRASRVDLRKAVGGGSSGVASSTPGRRWRRGLLVTQLALCTLLLLGAGLLTRTLLALRAVDPGFAPGSILALTMLPENDAGRSLPVFYAEALAQARRVPGVRAVSLAGGVPGRRGLNLPLRVPGREESGTAVGWRYVSPGYFELLRIPLLAGRSLTERDTHAAEPVVVINRALARRYFPDGDAIGRQIQVYPFAPEAADPPRTIVGLVGDTLDSGPRDEPEPRMYVATGQIPPAMFPLLHRWFDACWLIDTDLAPAVAAQRLGAVLGKLRPGTPFSEVTPLREVVAAHVTGERFLAWLLGAFALVALCIAATGIYGLTAHSVNHRAREIAIRMALGASPARVLRGILGEGLVVAAVGILLGLAAAWPIAPLLGSFLYGAASFDATTTTTVIVVLLAAALLASLAPAARAARIDPSGNLRQG